MRVLFIGGTGIISTACARLAAERGIELTLMNRGSRRVEIPSGVKAVVADIEDPAAAARTLGGAEFDSVVDWVAYTPAHIERDLNLFRGRTPQYVFISSASANQKPPTRYLISESTPLHNPFWQYSQDKIACEERLMRAYREEGFPVTIVRPSLTYGDTQIPLSMNSWTKPFTLIRRMRQNKKIIVPGDGTSLWVITHNTDFAKGFVGLLGNRQSIGHAFNITSDEVMAWNQFFAITAEAAGTKPEFVHIASDFISACLPDHLGGLLGDKSNSAVFDNSKIKQFVPDYCATVPFSEGIRRTLAWFDADPARQQVDLELDAAWDKLIDVYESGFRAGVASFRSEA
jgi:nucleoside-diphosphate-sugar epimerase